MLSSGIWPRVASLVETAEFGDDVPVGMVVLTPRGSPVEIQEAIGGVLPEAAGKVRSAVARVP